MISTIGDVHARAVKDLSRMTELIENARIVTAALESLGVEHERAQPIEVDATYRRFNYVNWSLDLTSNASRFRTYVATLNIEIGGGARASDGSGLWVDLPASLVRWSISGAHTGRAIANDQGRPARMSRRGDIEIIDGNVSFPAEVRAVVRYITGQCSAPTRPLFSDYSAWPDDVFFAWAEKEGA